MSMTVDQFMAGLEGIRGPGWHVLRTWLYIRCAEEFGLGTCPVSELANATCDGRYHTTNGYLRAAEDLGLSRDDAMLLADAADNIDRSAGTAASEFRMQQTRKRMLAALDLQDVL